MHSFHSVNWWRNHLEKTGLVAVESCNHMGEGTICGSIGKDSCPTSPRASPVGQAIWTF